MDAKKLWKLLIDQEPWKNLWKLLTFLFLGAGGQRGQPWARLAELKQLVD